MLGVVAKEVPFRVLAPSPRLDPRLVDIGHA